ncbi:hypothetical protein, partial [Deinococcus aerolatus]|uniref:hypothetical protein n=1 Tax=Deinococcus aerolatus TaxID=522487 RepID=UPI001E586536
EEDRLCELRIPAAPLHPAFLRPDRTRSGQVGAQVTLIYASGRDHGEDEIDDTLQRVVAEERHASFEVAGQFGTLKIGGFWSRHTPKTPPIVVPVRNQAHV